MKTIATVNQKGGCGKTTTAINLSAALAETGKRVLLIDLDPQAHATIGLGQDPNSFPKTIHDALTRPGVGLCDVAVHTTIERLDLAPCNVLLAGAEMSLAGVSGKELLLARGLRDVRDAYDVCVIDCPPSLGILTLNALVASTDLVVPVQVHYYALEGLRRLLDTAGILRQRFHPCSVENIGLLLTFVEERTTFSRQVQQQVRNLFGDLVFETVIHRNVRLTEAPSAGEPVLRYAPRSKAAADYRSLAAEILEIAPQTMELAEDRMKRGIQKQVGAIFQGAWIPKRQRSRNPAAPVPPFSLEST